MTAMTATSCVWYVTFIRSYNRCSIFRFICIIYSQEEFLKGRKRYSCDSDDPEGDNFDMDEESDDGDGK